MHWSTHPDAQQVRVTRSAAGRPRAAMAVTGNSCQLTGLPEGEAQHFEVTAVYQSPDGAEMLSAVEQVNATPRSEAQPIPRLRVRTVEAGGAVRVRVAWAPVDNSDVHILCSDTPPGWPFGTRVAHEEMMRFGEEVAGSRVAGRGGELAVETDLPPGIHHLVPFSIGGTGIVVGRPTAVGHRPGAAPGGHVVRQPRDRGLEVAARRAAGRSELGGRWRRRPGRPRAGAVPVAGRRARPAGPRALHRGGPRDDHGR